MTPLQRVTVPRSRTLALSVVIDGRLEVSRARQVAVLAGRLGLAGVWLRYPWWPGLAVAAESAHSSPAAEPAALSVSGAADPVALLTSLTAQAPLPAGLLIDADADSAKRPGRPGASLLAAKREKQETGNGPFGMQVGISGSPAAVGEWRRELGRGSGTLMQVAVPAGEDGEGVTALLVPFGTGRDLRACVVAAAQAARGRPVLAEVTVSVGRTSGEARARADAEELFAVAGHPADQGLFGTLEECQAAAASLAHAGATELICSLPLASDLPDVLAQLTAIAIGAAVLVPGQPPSQSPPPPIGWGGRRIDG